MVISPILGWDCGEDRLHRGTFVAESKKREEERGTVLMVPFKNTPLMIQSPPARAHPLKPPPRLLTGPSRGPSLYHFDYGDTEIQTIASSTHVWLYILSISVHASLSMLTAYTSLDQRSLYS